MIICSKCSQSFNNWTAYYAHPCAALISMEIAGKQQEMLAVAIHRLCDLLERKLKT